MYVKYVVFAYFSRITDYFSSLFKRGHLHVVAGGANSLKNHGGVLKT